MPVFDIWLERRQLLEISVRANNESEARKAAENAVEGRDLDDYWHIPDSGWEVEVYGPSKAEPDHGVAADRNGNLIILTIDECPPEEEHETEEQRRQREFAETEAAGQLVLWKGVSDD